ncbi:unnamed protein product [Mytilus coruscus]|uniref:DZIP3-like HEPN domain-containing protein n=1 Tax=Mytilus coruscus TaxID=42192 RepID=A0A6J8BHZ8_MYTCO|nr:unnamed protein product [Mytilus coruscus]
MSVTPEDRQARLGCVILKLFPTIMQSILKGYTNPRGLRVKFQLKDIRTTLTLSETSLMEHLPNIEDFTVELCYKILRYENLIIEPACKWGNIPHDTEVEISDDIQRIINLTNEVISKECGDISEIYYNEFLEKTKDVTKRVDGHLQQDTCFKVFTTTSSLDINPADILQELALVQKVNVSAGSPSTKGWGLYPDKGDIKLGDDVERMRNYRNQTAHRTNISIDKNEFENYFDHFRNIGRRMDLNFFRKTNYEETIILHKTCRMDIQMQIKYENALKELENIKLRFERTPIKFYWGDSFDKSLVHLRSIMQDEKGKGRPKVRLQIIFQSEADVERTIDILNSLKDEINEGLSGIQFIVAKKGCIVLNVDLKLDMLETDERLQSVLALFMAKILEHMMTSIAESIDIVMILVEEYQVWNKTNAESVSLHFDVEADLFETDDKMEKELKQISESFCKHFNGSGTNSNITASLLPLSLETTEEAFGQAQSPIKYNLPVSVTLQKQLNIRLSENESLFMSGCIKMYNTLVLTDASYNKRLIICKVDGTGIHLIPLSHKPDYITKVDSNTVAVSCIYDRTILIINISTGDISSKINISCDCHGISYDANNLYVVAGDRTIRVIDMTGNSIRVVPIPLHYAFDIAVQRDRLVYIDTKAIYFCSLDGNLMWKFENEKYKSLRHVTSDDEGNVYVTDRNTNTVVVVSDDAKHYREILTESDGLNKPFGIHFDKRENVLLVNNFNEEKVFLFDIKRNVK